MIIPKNIERVGIQVLFVTKVLNHYKNAKYGW